MPFYRMLLDQHGVVGFFSSDWRIQQFKARLTTCPAKLVKLTAENMVAFNISLVNASKIKCSNARQ